MKKMNDYKNLYDTIPEFKKFVDKTCRNYDFTTDEALKLATIREVGDYYEKKQEEALTVTRLDVGCGGAK